MSIVSSSRTATRPKTVALAGNPNTGKSTLFNTLTGFRQRVGNYPGVTVEKRTGFLRGTPAGTSIQLIDLPGAYSLGAQGADEGIVMDVLLGQRDRLPAPDVIVCVVDAANLGRNLFLATQVLEIGQPVVVALTMTDLAESSGLRIDVAALRERLGVAVVSVVATKNIGVDSLREAIQQAVDAPPTDRCPSFPDCVCAELDGLQASLASQPDGGGRDISRVEALQTLLEPGGYHESRVIKRCGRGLANELAERRQRIASAGESIAEVEARVRYAWIDSIVQKVVTQVKPPKPSKSQRVDRFLTHRVVGLAFFLLLMGMCFQSIYAWAGPVMNAIDGTFVALGGWLGELIPTGPLQSLMVNGVVAGVGAIFVFLPQILILFLFITILEDCGYMARSAFLLDRWMGLFGLGGKSFIPLLSSFACAIPGIMATRTIENRRDRFVTILIAPLMSCSARLPVYVLLIAAFVPSTPLLGGLINMQAITLLAMYLVGVVVAIAIALVVKATILKGPPQSFLMELPTYKWPRPSTVLYRVYEQGREFCVTAGTIIFAVALIVWALGYYPHPASIAQDHDARRAEAAEIYEANNLTQEEYRRRLNQIDRDESGAYLRQSLLGRAGRWIEPVVAPLGWDWRIGTAAIAAFPAREVVLATMGTIYNLGDETHGRSAGLREKLQAATWPDGRPVFNLAVALSIMVFFALSCQCGSTLAVIRRETNSWRWPIATFVYMTTLGYLGALVTYQVVIRFV